MNKELNFFTKLACKIIGWNSTLLKECGEASYRALRKYISAFIILSVIWGTTGYLFAGKYMGVESTIARCAIALTFIAIVICIERFIILKVGRSYTTASMRVIIALLMATLGATIFDQMIFKNDLEVAMKAERDQAANEAIERRLGVLNNEMERISLSIDSVQKEITNKSHDIGQKPYIKTIVYETQRVQDGVDDLGKPVWKVIKIAKEETMPNPMCTQLEADLIVLENYKLQFDRLVEKKLSLADEVREEYAKAPVGFLEELKVLFRDVIMKETVALVFYLCLFFFMMSLEMLVVTSKMGEKDCDYDLIVEHQLMLKEEAFNKAHHNLA